jgi:multidrug efflux pump subunit AcrA (membrane-fusion protein)
MAAHVHLLEILGECMRGAVLLMVALSSAPIFGQEAVVQASSVWSDTVKRGDMVREVRGVGTVRDRRTVDLHVAETTVKDIRADQQVSIHIGKGKPVVGRVYKVDPSILNGMVPVTVKLGSTAPTPMETGLRVDGTIVVGRLADVIYVGRPAFANDESEGTLFRIDNDNHHATRVRVLFGRASANTIEIRKGLRPGDRVILSDMRAFEGQSRIHLQ